MFWKTLLLPLAGFLLLTAAPALAQSVSVEVVDDSGAIFPTYPVDAQNGSWRAYLEAERQARYGIRIRNNTDRRIGLVIAVDGRNIVSGEKSYLQHTERMYILSPYAEETYRGWRSGRNDIQRFYFTVEGDSYAGAWGDGSAMGVIAVAVYGERPQEIRRQPPSPPDVYMGAPLNRAPEASARMDSAAPRMESAEEAPGTGWGERERSRSREVEFKAERRPLEKHFYKYEWRETLCRKRIISCRPERPRRENRMWDDDDDGYAPPPPGERHYRRERRY